MEFLDFFSQNPFGAMLVRLVICLISTIVIVDRLYYKKSRRRDFYFTFMLISLAIFFLVFYMIFALEDLKSKTSIGIGIGLFGIFSIMRYRTDSMPVREMTYLFVIVAMSVVNAIAAGVPLIELAVTNLIFIVSIYAFERRIKVHPSRLVQYDRLELIKPERRAELIADLNERLGFDVLWVEIGAVDLLKDMAMLRVYYSGNSASGDAASKIKLTRNDLTDF